MSAVRILGSDCYKSRKTFSSSVCTSKSRDPIKKLKKKLLCKWIGLQCYHSPPSSAPPPTNHQLISQNIESESIRLNYQIMNCCSCFNFNNMIILLHFTFIKASIKLDIKPPSSFPFFSYLTALHARSTSTTHFVVR